MKEENLRKAIEGVAEIATLHIYMSASYFAHIYEQEFNELPHLDEVIFVLERAYDGFEMSAEHPELQEVILVKFNMLIRPILTMVEVIPPIINKTVDNKVQSIEINFEYILPEVSKFIENYVRQKKISVN